MSDALNIVLAGFGGQGILFAGKVVAVAGLIENREVSWLPSYGPEMRGGTANCSVCLSNEPIGSPLVTAPDALIAMNQPSFDKFVDTVVPGGVIIADSALVPRTSQPDQVSLCSISATESAEKEGLKGLGNIVCVGKLFALTGFCKRETLDTAIEKCVPASKKAMIEKNIRALELGIALGESA